MDSIIQAIDLIRAGETKIGQGSAMLASDRSRRLPVAAQIRMAMLREESLEEKRIVGHVASAASKSFDVLRTQVLKEMDRNNWQFLAVTSPTAGCGKSTIACNLALSISRLTDRAPILVDMDFRKPSVARYLGLDCNVGIIDLIRGTTSLNEAMINAVIGPASLFVLPGRTTDTADSSDWMASQSLVSILQMIKREHRNQTVIFDCPPIMDGGDIMSILPRMDAALLVAAAGSSTIEDMQSCRQQLEEIPIVRVVINKAPPLKN